MTLKEKRGTNLPNKRKSKRRMICHPNESMRTLHHLFGEHLKNKIDEMDKKETYGIRFLPSATGCVKESNPLINAKKHSKGEHFYITDFSHAYQSVDLRRLALLLVFIEKYSYYKADYSLDMFVRNELAHFALSNDPLFAKMESFVQIAFGGYRGEGIAVGGPLSPFLLNLYCEVFLDRRLRYYFYRKENKQEPEKSVTYTRYVDDLVFSSGVRINDKERGAIRRMISEAGFKINHRKSFVLDRKKGAVFVTKVGLRENVEKITTPKWNADESIIVFPQKKRRRLHGIIQSFLKPITTKNNDTVKIVSYWNDSPEVISGLIAEFLYYYKRVLIPTKTDERTMLLCRKFETVASPYLSKLRYARNKKQDQKK